MIYLLDTNAVTDIFEFHLTVRARAAQRVNAGDQLMICRLYYEVLRGLLWRKAPAKLRRFQKTVLPLFNKAELQDEDWEKAAELWANARSRGR